MKKITIIATCLLLSACQEASDNHTEATNNNATTSVSSETAPVIYATGNIVKDGETYLPLWVRNQSEIAKVLSHQHHCADNLVLRYQSMSKQAIDESCQLLLSTEQRFHQLFNRKGKPVLHDNNTVLRANIYASRDDYASHVTNHFDVPANNGGMYLEGLPHLKENSAEYVAYLRGTTVWNLNHEFVHYLDGRFNTYGDYCSGLHDNHAGPEYCPKPAPNPPYLTWWTEGIAEYVAHMKDNPKAVKLAKDKTYQLSELLYNSGEGWNTDKVYRWGYLAARYMMENQREKVEEMLFHTRRGDFPRYQALILQWGTSMDEAFHTWLETL